MQINNGLAKFADFLNKIETLDQKERETLWVSVYPQLIKLSEKGSGFGSIFLKIRSAAQKDLDFLKTLSVQTLLDNDPFNFVTQYILDKEPGLIKSLIDKGYLSEKNYLLSLESSSKNVKDFLSRLVYENSIDNFDENHLKSLNAVLYREITEMSLVASDDYLKGKQLHVEDVTHIIDMLLTYKKYLVVIPEFHKTWGCLAYLIPNLLLSKDHELLKRVILLAWDPDIHLSDFHANLRLMQTIKCDINKPDVFADIALLNSNILVETRSHQDIYDREKQQKKTRKKAVSSNSPDLS